jgi:hypothetical protein
MQKTLCFVALHNLENDHGVLCWGKSLYDDHTAYARVRRMEHLECRV